MEDLMRLLRRLIQEKTNKNQQSAHFKLAGEAMPITDNLCYAKQNLITIMEHIEKMK